MSLEIPVYAMWDCDKKAEKIDGELTNRALQKLFGSPANEMAAAGTIIADNFACFECNLEKTLEKELGVQQFEGALAKAMKDCSVEKKEDAIKAPAIMKQTLAKLAEQKIISPTLEAVLQKICALKSQTLTTTLQGT